MKLSHLKQIVAYLERFKQIVAAHRVDDNLIRLVFDKEESIYFDMRKSASKIFKTKKEIARTKIYNAPFDILLAKHCNRAKIENIALVNGDKVLRFSCLLQSAYKTQRTFLQFEFTGKHTNAILLDEEERVIEALRHVDLFSSFREVKVGQKLLPLPKPNFTPKEYPLEDVESFLYAQYEEEAKKKLQSLKKQKIAFLEKKRKKLQKRLEALEDEQELNTKADQAELFGNLVLMHLHTIKPYQTNLQLTDYEGKERQIQLEKPFAKPSDISEHFFKTAKKLRQKAANLHKEKDSLNSKITYYDNFIEAVRSAEYLSKLAILFPKRQNSRQTKQDDSIESFYIEGYKVQLGKNERGNVALLQNAKARDIWLHLKDRPSCHVIIRTDKQNVPQNVIEAAAKLCVEFTTTQKDRFLVDYTQRREVKIQEGANVLYNKYKTIEVDTRSQ